jgi:small conductance mechanosensitive channel
MDVSAALSALSQKIAEWFETFVTMLPNLGIALVVLVVFWFLARLAMRLTEKGLARASDNGQVVWLFASIMRVATMALGLFIALGVMDLDKTVTSLLAGVGVLGIALGFAFQDIAANFVAGVLLAFRRPFHVGDLIETNDYTGRIERTDFRATVMRLLDGPLVIIPNKEVFQNPIVNFSQAARRRVEVTMGVSYATDLEQAQRLAVEAVTPISVERGDGKVELYYKEFGASSIDFVVRFWIDSSEQKDTLETRSQMVKRIKAAYDEHGIDIPFPMRTLDLGLGDSREFFERLLRQRGDADADASPDSEPNGKDAHADTH